MEETAVAKDNGFTLRFDPGVAGYISDGGRQFFARHRYHQASHSVAK